MDRAYSLLEIKAVDAEQRIIEGIASTPSADRGGDIMDPAGAQFSLPMPFLWFHDDKNPIGEVFAADVRPEGIYIKARVAKVSTPGRIKTLVDDAWASFTAQPPLVRGLSIGWSALESEAVKGGFRRVSKWIWGELSAVTIPMNTEATIFAVKTADQAASGRHTPSVSGTLPVTAVKAAPAMTTQEQIVNFENSRNTKAGRMQSIMSSASEKGETLDQAQTEEYDTLSLEVKSIDAHLTRLREMSTLQVATATPITSVTTAQAAADLRGGSQTLPQITVKSMAPKGTAFTRMAMALAGSKGDSYQAMQRAESYRDMPEVALMTKAAVAAGSTTDSTWAGPLAVAQPLVDEFLELLRPRTLLGQIPGLRQVPFNVSVPAQTTGGTYAWVGQNKPKPVTKADLAASVAVFTAAGIPLAGSVWLMSDSNAWGLSISVNALGQPMFPGMSAQGGTLFGMPVIVSNNVSNRIVLVHAPSILFADEGGVSIDVSREASIQMDSAPTDTVDATTVYVSLWQRNLVGLRAERMITWIRARTAAVRYITAAAYVGS